ncbi:MAG: disulfide oxidoreductase [Chloroflexota bacterium]|jgi:disulfide bond formation protein DsbB
MDANTVATLYGIAALAGILILIWFGFMYVASRLSAGVAESYGHLRARLSPLALTGAWGVALLAAAGSLYFSEVANWLPCTLCWYQRIAMYPLVLILGIAAFRRDVAIRIYVIPLASVGAAIAAYHYLLEWFPEIDTGACSAVIPCTQVWFREFGFVSLPLLALIAFGLVITFLLIPSRATDDDPSDEIAEEDGDEEDPADPVTDTAG